MKRKILNLVLVLLFAIAILMPTSNSTAIADELGYASEQQQERGAFDILKTQINVTPGMTTSAYSMTPMAGTQVTWSVNDTDIATISGNGMVTGVKRGHTYLTAQIYIPGLTTMTKITYINVMFETDLFYIRNKNSGQYLTVSGSANVNNANVIQTKHTGSIQDARLWKLTLTEDNCYEISTNLSGDNRLLTVDLSSGTGVENSLNVKLSNDVNGTNQRFQIISNDDKCTYQIASKCSSFTKVITVQNASCDQNANVFQYLHGTAMNDEWFFEPYVYSADYAINYALEYADTNNNGTGILGTYPYFVNRDCANFVSQCLAAGGISFRDQWSIYKKNNSADMNISVTDDMDVSWELQPLTEGEGSPWISAPRFYDFWTQRVPYASYTGQQIATTPTAPMAFFQPGDVLQFCEPKLFGDGYKSASHTMFITGIDGNDFLLSAHTEDRENYKISNFLEEDNLYVFLKFN